MFVIWLDDLEMLGSEAFGAREWRWYRTLAGVHEEGRGDLDAISELLAAEPDEVHLLIAARECLPLALTAPPMSSRNLELALPYLAEEKIAVSVDETHFVPSQRIGEQLTAFGISKSLLTRLLASLSDFSVTPVAAYSDASVIQLDAEALQIMIDSRRVLMRTPVLSLETDLTDLPELLPALVAQASVEPADTTVKLFSSEEAEDPGLTEALSELGLEAVSLTRIRSPLAQLASHGFSTATNLLVGTFAPTSRSTGASPWRLPVALAASLLALLIASDLAVGMIASNRVAALQEASISELGSSATADEVVRIVNREQGGGEQDTSYFIDLLSVLSALTRDQGASVKSLSYQRGSRALDVEVIVADYDGLDVLTSQAQSSFLEADMLGATQTEEGVRARLRLAGRQP